MPIWTRPDESGNHLRFAYKTDQQGNVLLPEKEIQGLLMQGDWRPEQGVYAATLFPPTDDPLSAGTIDPIPARPHIEDLHVTEAFDADLIRGGSIDLTTCRAESPFSDDGGVITQQKIRAGALDLTDIREDPDSPGTLTTRQHLESRRQTTTATSPDSPEPASDQAPPTHPPAPQPALRWRDRLASALRRIADLLTRAGGSSGS